MAKKRKVPKKYTAGLSSDVAAKRRAAIRARAKSGFGVYSELPGNFTKSGKRKKIQSNRIEKISKQV